MMSTEQDTKLCSPRDVASMFDAAIALRNRTIACGVPSLRHGSVMVRRQGSWLVSMSSNDARHVVVHLNSMNTIHDLRSQHSYATSVCCTDVAMLIIQATVDCITSKLGETAGEFAENLNAIYDGCTYAVSIVVANVTGGTDDTGE